MERSKDAYYNRYLRGGRVQDQEWKDGEVSRLGACQYPHRI